MNEKKISIFKMKPTQEQPVYSAFAEIYDQVMRDVDYDSWAEHVLSLCRNAAVPVEKVLDLACGTGSLALRLARRGYHLTGVDQSADMLEQARLKFADEGLEADFHQGRMNDFSHLGLDRDYDLVTCLYDSINYLLEEAEVRHCFEQTCRHLHPGGVFICDVTTEYNLLQNFAGFTFAENLVNASYIWENEYDIVRKVCRSKVTMFIRRGNTYRKQVENHVQRVYPSGQLTEWLRQSGYEVLGLFHNMTEMPPQERCERIHFVCRKPE
jgi:2-polyprenyl-3-methyl-5-hydroxy-6-metoxy-1,4-benzoquinol methylase